MESDLKINMASNQIRNACSVKRESGIDIINSNTKENSAMLLECSTVFAFVSILTE